MSSTIRVGLALLAALLGAPSASGQQVGPGPATQAAPDAATQLVPDACPGGAGYLHCRGGCEPGKLIFLPCMAVGAVDMSSCRQREVASCLRACVSRHCS